MRTMTGRRAIGAVLALVAVATVAVGCSSSDSDGATKTDSGSTTAPASSLKAIRVPQDVKTIQGAVDKAKSGDLILVSAGVYKEAVDVSTPDITIRGVDRNKTILEGSFKLENGIRILDTDGVVVENMTARDYLSNGFYWTGSDRYRGSYLTAYRNGDYGIYAFDAYHGQFDHSAGWGSPDAGFYIGECYKCDAVVDHVDSQYNGLGYSGTNSGGDLYLINSNWANNRAGMVPNSGSYELCYPSRGTTVIGNTVHDNNYLKGPGIDVSLLAQGNGILLAGAINADVERNLVYNHDRTGIAAVPYPEDDANDNPPPASELDKPCDETKDKKLPDPKDVPDTVLWNSTGSRYIGNVVSNSGLADLASATVPIEDVAGLDNCFSGNTFKTTAPTALEDLAPCDGKGNGGDFTKDALDLGPLIADQPAKPAKNSYRTTPIPPAQDQMPGALTKAAEKFTAPEKPDLDAIKVPKKPS